MKKQIILSWVMLAVTVVLGVVSYIVLPETVTTQLSIGSTNATTMPKLFAVLIPFALGAGGALSTIFLNNGEKNNSKGMVVSVVGIVVFALMLLVNL